MAKPEGCFCYPLRRASPGAPPWCSGCRRPHPCRAGACPSRWFVPFYWGNFAAPAASGFLSDQKATKESPGVCSGGQATSILIWIWPVHSHCTPDPVYGGAWFGGLAQTYRRGVVSDTKLFSRPLPLCGDDQRTTASTRLDAPPLVLPRGAEGVGWRNPVGRGLAPAVVLHCILGDFVGAAPRGRPQVHSMCPPRHSEAPEGPWESVFLDGGTDCHVGPAALLAMTYYGPFHRRGGPMWPPASLPQSA